MKPLYYYHDMVSLSIPYRQFKETLIARAIDSGYPYGNGDRVEGA
jgi:hypothetical protein